MECFREKKKKKKLGSFHFLIFIHHSPSLSPQCFCPSVLCYVIRTLMTPWCQRLHESIKQTVQSKSDVLDRGLFPLTAMFINYFTDVYLCYYDVLFWIYILLKVVILFFSPPSI